MAQPGGGGPLRDRLQKKVQGEIDRKAAETRAEIERQIAARPSPAEIAQVRQVQTALNYFTFDAGPVDGIMGGQTRAAIEEFQTFLDYPVTGELSDSEARFLLMSYQQAQANSAQAKKVAASHPEGIKGLLLVFRDGAPSQPTGVIPSFRTAGDQRDLSAFCAQTAALPPSGGSAPSLDRTLGMLFCNARDAAIVQGQKLASNVAGFALKEIEEQCVAFEPALASLVASVSEDPAIDVVKGAAEFAQRTGQDPVEMSGIAKVCLGVGYRREQRVLAIGSAVLLTALDAPIYAEHAGYHLALGFGAGQDPARARAWFEIAMQSETDPLSEFETQAIERLGRLQTALLQSGVEDQPGAIPMPSFSVSD